MSSYRAFLPARVAWSIGFFIACYAIVIYPGCDSVDRPPGRNFTVDPESATLRVGEIVPLRISDNNPSNFTSQITWQSSDEAVATVFSENSRLGVVSARSEGTTEIRVEIIFGRD